MSDNAKSVAGAVIVLIIFVSILLLIVYTFYCYYNWYCANMDYMKETICQQKINNETLKDISSSLKELSSPPKSGKPRDPNDLIKF